MADSQPLRVLVIGANERNPNAVNGILWNAETRLASFGDIVFTNIGFGPNDDVFHSKGIATYSLTDATRRKVVGRIKRKALDTLRRDTGLLGWQLLYRKGIELSHEESFDVIVGAAGDFANMKAAFELSQTLGIPFFPMYFDGYTNNPTTAFASRRALEEKRWLQGASAVAYDADGIKPIDVEGTPGPEPFFIPIFSTLSKQIPTSKIVYGGLFYPDFRPASSIERLMDAFRGSDYEFEVFSNQPSFQTANPNCHARGLVAYEEYQKACSEACAFIVLGNATKEGTIPSKLLETMGYGKPIIGMNFAALPEHAKRYPLFLNGDENMADLPQKLASLLDKRESVDIFSLFPERNPDRLCEQLRRILFSVAQKKDGAGR